LRRSPALRLIAAAALLAACGDETGPSNAGPTAAFTADCARLECTFTNTSTDLDGRIEEHDWNFGDRTTHGTTKDAVHTYASAGRFIVTLTVTDDDGSTSTASYQVEVKAPNAEPTARFTVSCAWLTCDFTSQSFDGNAGGSLAGYAWDFGDDSPPVTTRDASHTYGAAGRYTVSLTIRDNEHAVGVATQELDLRFPNLPPAADFTFSCTDLTCEFIDLSSDGEGSVVQHSWSFGDGQASSEPNPTHTFAVSGFYLVRLTVTDAQGSTGSTTRELTVPSPPPTPYISWSCSSLTCGFYGDHYADRPVVRYDWDFGDGETSDQQSPQHTYASPGTYTVQLTVTDDRGETGSASLQLTVPPPAPTAAFTVACDGTSCSFTNQSTGVFLEGLHWDFGDGQTSSAGHPTHVYDVSEPTTFTVTLSVFDWDWSSDSVSHDVTVTPSGSSTLRTTAE
jgi:PKD repeat protein